MAGNPADRLRALLKYYLQAGASRSPFNRSEFEQLARELLRGDLPGRAHVEDMVEDLRQRSRQGIDMVFELLGHEARRDDYGELIDRTFKFLSALFGAPSQQREHATGEAPEPTEPAPARGGAGAGRARKVSPPAKKASPGKGPAKKAGARKAPAKKASASKTPAKKATGRTSSSRSDTGRSVTARAGTGAKRAQQVATTAKAAARDGAKKAARAGRARKATGSGSSGRPRSAREQ